FTVSADSAAPTTTILCSAAACLNGTYYTSAPVSVTLSANDGAGSGVQKIRYTTDGTDPTPVNGSDYSGAISINSTATVKFRAYDNLGNEEPVGSQDILLDGTPPDLSLALTENPTSGAQHAAAATHGGGATTSVPFTPPQDSAAPAGQSITLTGANAPYYGSASVSFTLGDGNDGSGSGLDTSSRTVTRESASLTGDSC